jgi:cytochrome bd ubiquinol oxidase subunit II
MNLDITLVWGGLLAFVVLAYIIFDGYDLGVGILIPLMRSDQDRSQMLESVRLWDANETWLVLGGGGLFAMFPLAYSIIFPALYLPLIGMLLSLVVRGVVSEFRWQNKQSAFLWDGLFFVGSFLAACFQGMILGALVQGIHVVDHAYAGGPLDWLTPFSVMTGIALALGYSLLGATWLVLKTNGELQNKAFSLIKVLGCLMVVMVGVVSLWTPFLKQDYLSRWFAWPQAIYVLPVPLLLAAAIIVLFKAVNRRNTWLPFVATISIFLLSYIGLLISIFPYVVPGAITLWEAAAPISSQKFLLPGTLILVPIILIYTSYAHWVFLTDKKA